MTIKYTGFKQLSPKEVSEVHRICNDHAEKLSHATQSPIKVVLKEHHSDGKRTKFSIHIQLTSGSTIEANSADWNLHTALHKTFDELETQLEKRAKL